MIARRSRRIASLPVGRGHRNGLKEGETAEGAMGEGSMKEGAIADGGDRA